MDIQPRDPETGRMMTKFTPELAKMICDGVANGKSSKGIMKSLGLDFTTLCAWRDKYPEFEEDFLKAKERCADYLAEDIMDVAEEEPRTFINKDGNPQVDNGWVNNQKNRIQARQWAASVMRPKKYGNQSNVTVDVNVKLSERLEKALKDVTPKAALIEHQPSVEQFVASDNAVMVLDGNNAASEMTGGSVMQNAASEIHPVTDDIVEDVKEDFKEDEYTKYLNGK